MGAEGANFTGKTLFVSCGEASGDQMVARVLEAIQERVQVIGMGGAACVAQGLVPVARMEDVAAMGLLDVARKAKPLVAAYRRLVREVRENRPHAALLVGFSSFHQVLGRRLRQLAVPVLWCGAPQVWAWRPSRLRSLRASLDRLAVVLPFEEKLWKRHGYDVHYVGHPASDTTELNDAPLRTLESPSLAVLCGSRDQEARDAGAVLIEVAARWKDAHPSWTADLLLAESLPPRRKAALRQLALRRGIGVVNTSRRHGAGPNLRDYAFAFCVSGTASLEAAMSGTPPVVVYRYDWLMGLAAWALLRTRHIALPNVVLDAAAFPEIVERNLDPRKLLSAGEGLLHTRERALASCSQVRQRMELGDGQSFGSRVADVLEEMMRGG